MNKRALTYTFITVTSLTLILYYYKFNFWYIVIMWSPLLLSMLDDIIEDSPKKPVKRNKIDGGRLCPKCKSPLIYQRTEDYSILENDNLWYCPNCDNEYEYTIRIVEGEKE